MPSMMEQILARSRQMEQEKRDETVVDPTEIAVEIEESAAKVEEIVVEIEKPKVEEPVAEIEESEVERKLKKKHVGFTPQYAVTLFQAQVIAKIGGRDYRGVVVGAAYSLPDQQIVLVVMNKGAKICNQFLPNASTEENELLYPQGYSLWTKERALAGLTFLRVDSDSDSGGDNGTLSAQTAIAINVGSRRGAGE